ncbi:MAG: transposase [Deltaproteobacteria bacterium]|nr:transposase [Deltaproteobacteria bacterium]
MKSISSVAQSIIDSVNQFKEPVPECGAVSGAVIAIQTFGDFLGVNPHVHVPASDGLFYGEDMFRVVPRFGTTHKELG